VIAGVVDTGDKFLTGDNDTGDKFIACDIGTGAHAHKERYVQWILLHNG